LRLYASPDGTFEGGSLLAEYGLADAGTEQTFATLTLLLTDPPPVSLSIPGASKIDPDTELVDWHWKRPVANAAALPADAEEGDVRIALDTGVPHRFIGGAWGLWNLGGHVIQDEGVDMPLEAALSFVGAGVTVTDDPADGRTVVTIGSSGHEIRDEGSPRPTEAALDFVGAGVTVTDDAGGGRTVVTIPGGSAGVGTWRGAWASGTAYVANDVVSAGGSSWIAVANTTGDDPTTDGGAHWQLIAQKGDTGPTGGTGPTGATGSTGPAGPVGMNWLGAWDVATAYAIRAGVQRNGSSYIAVATSTGVDPATDDGTHWQLVAEKGDTGAAGLPSRADVAATAAGLAAGAEANVTMALGKAYTLFKIVTNRPARVRLYANAAYRTADAGRAIGTDPTGDHGLLMEIVTTAGQLSYALAPPVVGYNLEGPVTTDSPLRVTNLDAGAGDVTVTLTAIEQEA
jgi:hypothetical protein